MENIQPVDDFVRAGFLAKVQSQFRAATSWQTSPDKLAVLKTMLGNKQPEYPYIFLNQQSLNPNLDGYTSRRLARYGIPVRYSNDEKLVYNARIIPQNFEIEVTFITNKYDGDLESVQGFARRWHFARRNGYLQYRVNYGLSALDIAVVLADTIAIPMRENPGDTESIYQVVANATIKGYLSEPELAERQRILQVQTQVDVAPNPEAGTNFYPFPI